MFARLCLLLMLLALPFRAFADGGVVSAADPRAAEAGRQILREGGSAADAAMAMMLALTVVEPQSSGIGGGGFIVYHDAQTGRIGTIDGREAAPAATRPDRFLQANGTPMPFVEAWPGGYSVGIPGNVRLMERTHARWGKLAWARLFAPAIRLAEDGFTVTPRLNRAIGTVQGFWSDYPDIAALYRPGGAPAPTGSTIRNPALARLLRDIAARGPDAFYGGDNAAAITAAVAGSRHHPAAIGAADLATYRAVDRAAVCGRYRGYRICGMGPPSAGAITVLQILGMLERFDLHAMGPTNPTAWHLIGEAMRLAYADRDKYLGDPNFIPNPVAGMIDRTYLARRSRLIAPTHALTRYEAGTPPGAGARHRRARSRSAAPPTSSQSTARATSPA